MEAEHTTTVARIRKDIERFYETDTKFRIYHGTTNSTRHATFSRDAIVDVSALNHVLKVDVERKVAIVEPNVPMDALVRETRKYNLLPPVVMEFPGITVGGGFVGTAGESSSFRYGFFDRTVNWAEVILADGTMVTASSKENSDLFSGLAGSFGTLGVLTLLELRLIDLKPYVELTYHPVNSISAAMSKLQAETLNESNDYVDGILFSRTKGSIITGRLKSNPPSSSSLQRFSRAHDPWFYLHASRTTSSPPSSPHTEHVPISDYLFRYDRGAFWTGYYAFRYFMIPFNFLTRLLLDYFMHTRIMYHALHASGHTDRYIIQDLALPASAAASFLDFIDARFGTYPLWLCPLPPDTRGSMAHPHALATRGEPRHEQYINVGVWGPYPSSEAGYVAANRDIEAKVRELGGLKWLYARTFYTEDEFWGIYDRERYAELRARYRASGLPSVFEKVRDEPGRRREERFGGTGWKGMVKRWVLCTNLTRGFYGIWKAVWGGDYLLERKRK
ncbi:FAD-binding domain-containing protein [Polyplosphaeria fusca]|uniref:Delta(24)-sterol reductase n=1 Tax=Polyplosphaeria fusca TaxID=682080 RepID=A0A9P4QM13_9PLEO|nr:FAD-binding domain-containing protein [Polyplosphaeria fusca]